MSTDILLDQPPPTFNQNPYQLEGGESVEQIATEEDSQNNNITSNDGNNANAVDLKNEPSSEEDSPKEFVEDNNVTSSSSEEDGSSNSSGEDLSDVEHNAGVAAANPTNTSSSHPTKTTSGRSSRSNSKVSSSHVGLHNKQYINRSNSKCVRNPVTLVEEYSSSSLSSYTNSSSLSTENIFSVIKEIEDAVNSCNIIEFNNNSSEQPPIPAERPGRKLSISASSLPVVPIPGTPIPPIALSASAPSLPQSVSTTSTATCNDTVSPLSFSTTSTTPSKKNKSIFKFKKSKSNTPALPKSPSSSSINPSTSPCTSSDEEEPEHSVKKDKKKWKLSVRKKPKKPNLPLPLDLEPPPSKPQHNTLNQSHSNIRTSASQSASASQSTSQLASTSASHISSTLTTTTTSTTTTATSSTTTTATTTITTENTLFHSKGSLEPISPPVTTPTPSEELESHHEINSNINNNTESPSPSILSASMPLASNCDNPLHFYLEPDGNFKGNSFGGQGLLDMLADEEEMPRGGRGRSNAFYLKGPPALGANGEILPPPPVTSPKPPSPRLFDNEPLSNVLPKESASLLSKPTGLLSKFKKSSKNSASNVKSHGGIKVVKHHSSRFIVGFADTIGRRPNMEDETVIYGTYRGKVDEDYFALFDGHGGNDVAKLAAIELHKHLAEKLKATNNPVRSLKESFASLNKTIQEKNLRGGTTAVVALFLGKKGYVANVGDSRAVLCRDGVAVRVSNDHKPNDPKEEERIKALGGTVVTTVNSITGATTSRVNGQLAVSRALGDLLLVPFVSCEPDIFGPINLETHIKNQFMIIACDGIWDVMSDDEAISIVAPISDPEKACMKLREIAYQRRSTDNISVMVIKFPPFNMD